MSDYYHIPIKYDDEADGPCKACHQQKTMNVLKQHGIKIGRTSLYGHPSNCNTMFDNLPKKNRTINEKDFIKIPKKDWEFMWQRIQKLESFLGRYRDEYLDYNDNEKID